MNAKRVERSRQAHFSRRVEADIIKEEAKEPGNSQEEREEMTVRGEQVHVPCQVEACHAYAVSIASGVYPARNRQSSVICTAKEGTENMKEGSVEEKKEEEEKREGKGHGTPANLSLLLSSLSNCRK